MHHRLTDGGRVLDIDDFQQRLHQHVQQNMVSKEMEWDWDVEHADRERERRADGDHPFPVDRPVLRDLVREHMGADISRITFISSGTFHKAYLVTLVNGHEVVARVARRFMPRIKTESEVATLSYLRTHTNIPVPEVYHYDASPYNRLGGEYILMSKAPGIPLSKAYHSLSHQDLVTLLRNLANLVIPLFGHRFSHIGSLYAGPGVNDDAITTTTTATTSVIHTPKTPDFVYPLVPRNESSSQTPDILTPSLYHSHVGHHHSQPHNYFQQHHHHSYDHYHHHTHIASPLSNPLSLTPSASDLSSQVASVLQQYQSGKPKLQMQIKSQFHVGPIVSWPFFGSGRGDEPTMPSTAELPSELDGGLDRGPWRSFSDYLAASEERETRGVRKENEGRARPHRLRLDPDEVVPRTKDGTSGKRDRWRIVSREDGEDNGMSDSDSEESLPGAEDSSDDDDEDAMYRDYRRYQRSTFLVAHLVKREERVRKEMDRFVACMRALEKVLERDLGVKKHGEDTGGVQELFALDCHDLSLENVFVDEKDHSKITCIIDWESTTTRPLWACAHLPSFLLTSPFASQLFRKVVAELASGPNSNDIVNTKVTSSINSHSTSKRGPTVASANMTIASCANEWLRLEERGAWLRYAHKCVEWDGWEEELVDEILGETQHDEHHRNELQPGYLGLTDHNNHEAQNNQNHTQNNQNHTQNNHKPHHVHAHTHNQTHHIHNQDFIVEDDKIFLHGTGSSDALSVRAIKDREELGEAWNEPLVRSALATLPTWKLPPRPKPGERRDTNPPSVDPHDIPSQNHSRSHTQMIRSGDRPGVASASGTGVKGASVVVVPNLMKTGGVVGVGIGGVGVGAHPLERTLNQNGDVCGGRGGELGRRLEAWLSESSSDVTLGETQALGHTG